jgi:AcrR family transcriptional regulator
MGRTREAALSGAVRAVAKYGSRKATMGDIAMLAGIAKATLYNHFRTRDDVYRAVVAAEVDAIAAAAADRLDDGLEAALNEAARMIAEHPALRRIAVDEPAVLARLCTIGDDGAWVAAREHVATVLRSRGLTEHAAGVDLVLRYLGSQVLSPAGEADRRAATSLLAAAIMAQRSQANASNGSPGHQLPAGVPAQAGSSDTNS